jgi:hypothetical protein
MRILFLTYIILVFTVSCDVQEINQTVPSTQAKFSYTISNNSIAPARAVFINQSINAQGYLWKFGNGDTLYTLSSDSVIYTYEQAGTYTIRLEVEPTTPDLYYNNLVAEKTIVINDIPVKRLYFADRNEGKVKYVVLDNNLLPVIEEFESATLNKPYGMDMDTLTGKLYVTDYAEQLLNRFDWDGQRQEILMNSNSELFNSPIGIAVIGNKIYWGEPGGIHRADLDGLNPEIFLDMPNEYPQDIAYDPLNQAIYFTNNLNPESGGVWRVDVDGTNLTNVVKDVWGGAIEVLPDSNYVYYYVAYEGMYIAELNGDNPRLFDASNAGEVGMGNGG